jgi:hypothetical protein
MAVAASTHVVSNTPIDYERDETEDRNRNFVSGTHDGDNNYYDTYDNEDDEDGSSR